MPCGASPLLAFVGFSDRLLDTHVFLWMLAEPERLSATVRPLLEARSIPLHLSAASVWEIAIKVAGGKLRLAGPPARVIPKQIRALGLKTLPVQVSHACRVANLPLHHRDPFDRLLVAQAIEERLAIVSADPQLRAYPVDVIW